MRTRGRLDTNRPGRVNAPRASRRWSAGLLRGVAASALLGCVSASPASLPMLHEPVRRSAVGAGSVALLGGAGTGIHLNNMAGGEARVSLQRSPTFSIEASGGVGAQLDEREALVDNAPTPLYFGRVGLRWQPHGPNRYALRAGLGGGTSPTAIGYINTDVSLGYGHTYGGWVRPYVGFGAAFSVPIAQGREIHHAFPEEGASFGLDPSLWLHGMAGLSMRVAERVEVSIEATLNGALAFGSGGGGLLGTGTLLVRYFFGGLGE